MTLPLTMLSSADHDDLLDRLIEEHAPLIAHWLERLFPYTTQLRSVHPGALQHMVPDSSALNALTAQLQLLYADGYTAGVGHEAVGRKDWLPSHPTESHSGPALVKLQKQARRVALGVAATRRKRLVNGEHHAVHAQAQAELIAVTEGARGLSAGLLDSSEGDWDWLTDADPCPACAAMAASNPQGRGGVVPPLHPECRCRVSPTTSRS